MPAEFVSLFDDISSAKQTDWKPEAPPSLDGVDVLYIDTETNGLEWNKGSLPGGISIKRPGDKARYLPWGHRGGGNLDEGVMKRWAQRELRNKRLVGLAMKTEIHGLKNWGVDLEEQGCTVSDVQHSAALLDDYRRKFDMHSLAQDFLKREKIGRELDATRMMDYHSSTVAPRAEADAEITEALDLIMQPLIAAEDLQEVKQLEDDVIFPVCEMERNQVPLDEELLATWNRESEEEMHALLRDISQDVGFSFTPKTDHWMRLFHHCHLPIVDFTATGAPSFTDDILENQPNSLVQKGRRAAKIASLRSKFLVPYAREVHNGLLHYHLHQLRWEKPDGGGVGTVTGRFSSTDFNIQQVRKKSKQITEGETKYFIRQLFVPSEGLWFSADAEQIEFRLAAHYFNSARLNKAYADDPSVSFHRVVHEMVNKIKVISYDALKNLNFCLLYGGGRNKVASMLGVPRSESDQFVDAYYRAFPEAQRMIKHAASLAEKRGYVKTLTGRRSRFTKLPGEYDPRYYKGFNSVCQGGAADINKKKIVELHRERKYTGYLMRGTVHDETFGQVPDLESAARVIEVLNRQSYNLRVPIRWSGKTGRNWAEC